MSKTTGQTTGLKSASQSDSSLFSQPFSGPFIIEAVALTVSMLGVIGSLIALVHVAQTAQ